MTIIDTPEGIEAFHLLQLKHAIRLEQLGLRHSSGLSARKYAAELLGLPKPRTISADEVIEALTAKLTSTLGLDEDDSDADHLPQLGK